MKKTSVFVFFLSISLFSLFAQENLTAITTEGKNVLLKDDGTWAYIKDTEQKLALIDFDVINRDINYDESRYKKDVVLNLKIKNISGFKIIGYRVNIKITNGFGDLLHTLQLTSGKSVLENNEIDDANFVFEDNQFIDNEAYDNLSAYSKDNLIISISDSKILQVK